MVLVGLKLAGENKKRLTTRRAIMAAAGAASLFSAGQAWGASGQWNNSSGNTAWSAVSSWLGGTVADGAGNTADFSKININTTRTVTLDSARTIGALIIGDTDTTANAAYVLSGTATLTLDGGGAGATVSQIATSKGDQISFPVVLADRLTITNVSTGASTPILFSASSITSVGTQDLILNSNSVSGISINGAPVNISGTITNSGTGAGVVNITKGVGSGVTQITLNSTSSSLTIGSTGGGTMITVSPTSGTTVSNAAGVKTLTVSGGTTGTGDLILKNNSSLLAGITFKDNAVNNTGKLINSGTGSGSVTVGSVGSNVTEIQQNSTTSAMTISALTVQSGGTIVRNSLGTKAVDAAGTSAIAGTGDLIFKNDSASNAGVTASHGINITGSLINSGTGSGSATTAGAIGSGVAAIEENAASSAFTLGSTSPITVHGSATNATKFITTSSNAKLTVQGGTTGTGDLVLQNNSGVTQGITVSTTALNHSGAITNSGTGIGNVNVVGGIGSNVTSVIQDSTSSALLVSTAALTVNSGGTTLTNAKGGALLSFNTAQVSGTGNLILNNNSSLADGISLAAAVNNTGAIANSGTGSGNVLISGGIGSNVTSISQNSTSSLLRVSGSTSVVLTVNASGTTLINAAGGAALEFSTAPISGSGALTLKNNSSLTDGIKLAAAVNNTGALTNSGTGSGNTLISSAIGSNVSSVNQSSATSALTLSGNNTYTGPTNISAGTLHIIGTGAINHTSGVNVSGSGAVFQYDSTTAFSPSVSVSVSGGGQVAGTGSITPSLSVTGGAVNGTGLHVSGITFTGAGNTLTGTVTSSGTVQVQTNGRLAVNGALSGNVSVDSTSILNGSGSTYIISGAGMISPGNSPGILTATQSDPSLGTDYRFEFTQAGAPDYTQAGNSANDVLHLTGGTPFAADLTAVANTVDVYLQVGSLTNNEKFLGAWFTNDKNVDFSSRIQNADYQYFILGDGNGTTGGYYTLAAYNTAFSTSAGISVATIAAPGAGFVTGTVDGRVTEFTVTIPEPATIVSATSLLAVAVLARRRRHQRA